jgi:hypothetical protein
MTTENLKAWIIHFQKRIILSDLPKITNMLLLNLLTCKYNNVSCITNECEIVQYLNAHLPCLDYEIKEVPQLNGNVIYTVPIDPCSFYDLQVKIYIGEGSFAVTYTLTDNPALFIFDDGKFTIPLSGLINDFSLYFPNNLYAEVYVKTNNNQLFFTKVMSKTLIGYVNP